MSHDCLGNVRERVEARGRQRVNTFFRFLSVLAVLRRAPQSHRLSTAQQRRSARSRPVDGEPTVVNVPQNQLAALPIAAPQRPLSTGSRSSLY
ncbi:hypothetical protein SRHO_G00025830 [Serrasalmus rhombeus]